MSLSQTEPKPAKSLTRIALGWMAGGFALAASVAGGMALQAQAIAGHNSNAPVSFAADRIELQDRANRVILSGNVVINQANLQLTSARTLLNYNDAGGNLDLNRITATGGVVVTRGNERARGNTAIYDFNRRIITMAGNVQLNRGSERLSGGRLVIDLRSGVSSVDGSAAGSSDPNLPAGSSSDGRVRGTFSVPQN